MWILCMLKAGVGLVNKTQLLYVIARALYNAPVPKEDGRSPGPNRGGRKVQTA